MSRSDLSRQFNIMLFLLAAVIVALAFIVFVDFRAPLSPAGDSLPAHGLQIVSEKIDTVVLDAENLSLEVFRSQNNWTFNQPFKARADAASINRLLSGIESLPRLEVITETQRRARGIDLKDYGLEEPRASITLRGNDRHKLTLNIGNISPFKDMLYVSLGSHSEVIGTTTNLLSVLPKNIEDWRDKRLVFGNPSTVARIEIKQAQSPLLQIIREGSDWIIQRPVVARADSAKITEFLEQFFDLRVANFVSETMADPMAYGLSEDEASLLVSLWPESGDSNLKIAFGKTASGGSSVFAALASDTSVYGVPRSALDALPVSLAILRDARIYSMPIEKTAYISLEKNDQYLHFQKANGNWQIIAPVQVKADNQSVSDLLYRLNTLRIEEFVERSHEVTALFDQAEMIVHMAEFSPQGTSAQLTNAATVSMPGEYLSHERILRVCSVPANEMHVIAKFDDDQQVFRLSAAAINVISLDPADYRDLAVLSINLNNIRMITCMVNDLEAVLEKDAENNWQRIMPEGKTAELSTDMMEKILTLASSLRAYRFKRGNSSDLARYGLIEPSFSITFTLTGKEGIRKTLIGGQAAEDDGVFAMIQGQPGVFIIDQKVKALVSDLLAQE